MGIFVQGGSATVITTLSPWNEITLENGAFWKVRQTKQAIGCFQPFLDVFVHWAGGGDHLTVSSCKATLACELCFESKQHNPNPKPNKTWPEAVRPRYKEVTYLPQYTPGYTHSTGLQLGKCTFWEQQSWGSRTSSSVTVPHLFLQG